MLLHRMVSQAAANTPCEHSVNVCEACQIRKICDKVHVINFFQIEGCDDEVLMEIYDPPTCTTAELRITRAQVSVCC